MNPEISVQVTKRFFQAVEILKQTKEIRGLQTITRLWDINRRNLQRTKGQSGETPDQSRIPYKNGSRL